MTTQQAGLRIACVHTIASNQDIFIDAAATLAGLEGVEVVHSTAAIPLLVAAEAAGGLTDAIAAETSALLTALADGQDGVLLTCSTLGPGAERAAATANVPVLRVDAALAEAAVAQGRRIMVLCAVETTLGPTRALFERASAGRDVVVAYRIVEGAWARFRAGDGDGYAALIGAAADAASDEGYDVVALAQASMSGGARVAQRCTPLTSPAAGLAAIVAAAQSRQQAASARS